MKVVLLYDDLEIARDARALLDRVAPAGMCAVEGRHFSELVIPATSGDGPSETRFPASEADLVVVAIAGAPDLPASVKSWFRRWLSRHDPSRRGALVALFKNRGPEPDAALARMHLETVAALAGLEFFPGQISEPGHAVTWAQPAGTGSEPSPDPAGSGQVPPEAPSSVQHWGLNE